MTNEQRSIDQIRRAHKAANPNPFNPAWCNLHHDLGIALNILEGTQAAMDAYMKAAFDAEKRLLDLTEKLLCYADEKGAIHAPTIRKLVAKATSPNKQTRTPAGDCKKCGAAYGDCDCIENLSESISGGEIDSSAEDGQEHQCPECGRPCSKVGGNLCLKCTAVDRRERAEDGQCPACASPDHDCNIHAEGRQK